MLDGNPMVGGNMIAVGKSVKIKISKKNANDNSIQELVLRKDKSIISIEQTKWIKIND